MTTAQLNRQIAKVTGEPLRMVVTFGFSVLRQQDEEDQPDDIKLVLDCPFCGRPVAYPGVASDGSEPLAECDRCDVYFVFHPDEVYPIPVTQKIGMPTGSGMPRRS
jgi:hypothetical protein